LIKDYRYRISNIELSMFNFEVKALQHSKFSVGYSIFAAACHAGAGCPVVDLHA
jgi:hypothetical protein